MVKILQRKDGREKIDYFFTQNKHFQDHILEQLAVPLSWVISPYPCNELSILFITSNSSINDLTCTC